MRASVWDSPRFRAILRATMIGYVTLGTNDLARASAFYDSLLAEIGAKRTMEFPNGNVWGTSFDKPMLSAMRPYDGKSASVGNGTMVALAVDSPDIVKKIYDKAIELGGTDEGGPGPRGDSGFYAAYFRDLDGNKLNCFCMTKAG